MAKKIWVKNSWKCWGFVKIEFLDKNLTFRIVCDGYYWWCLLLLNGTHTHGQDQLQYFSSDGHSVWKSSLRKSESLISQSAIRLHTILKVKSANFFLIIFLVKSKLSTAKKSKTTTFSRVFQPKKIFPGNQSWFFGLKMKISNSVVDLTLQFYLFFEKNQTRHFGWFSKHCDDVGLICAGGHRYVMGQLLLVPQPFGKWCV